MINRILILTFVLIAFAVSAEAQAIKRVQNNKSDSTKVDKKAENLKEAERKAAIEKKQDQQKQQPPQTDKQKQQLKQRQDEFIDRDGDGINDKIIQSQQPVVKKQQPKQITTPKVPETKAPTETKQKKADTSSSTKKEDESKKSKR